MNMGTFKIVWGERKCEWGGLFYLLHHIKRDRNFPSPPLISYTKNIVPCPMTLELNSNITLLPLPFYTTMSPILVINPVYIPLCLQSSHIEIYWVLDNIVVRIYSLCLWPRYFSHWRLLSMYKYNRLIKAYPKTRSSLGS